MRIARTQLDIVTTVVTTTFTAILLLLMNSICQHDTIVSVDGCQWVTFHYKSGSTAAASSTILAPTFVTPVMIAVNTVRLDSPHKPARSFTKHFASSVIEAPKHIWPEALGTDYTTLFHHSCHKYIVYH